MKWYGQFDCWSRMDEWQKGLVYDFAEKEQPEIVMAVLLQMAYFPGEKKEAIDNYKKYLKYKAITGTIQKIAFLEKDYETTFEEPVDLETEEKDWMMENFFFLFQVKESIHQLERPKHAYAAFGEEWQGGVGKTTTATRKAYLSAKQEPEDPEFEEIA